MIVAGAMAASARLSGLGVFAISVAASVHRRPPRGTGLGRRYGYRVLKLLCRVSLSPDTCVRQTEGIFERYGCSSPSSCRSSCPGFSTVAPPIAGALDMRFGALRRRGVRERDAVGRRRHGRGLRSSARRSGGCSAGCATTRRSAATLVGALLAAVHRLQGVAALAPRALRRGIAHHRRRARVEARRGQPPPHVIDVGSSQARARPPAAYPGAMLLDLDEIDARANEFPTDRDIVLYCACPNEESARRGGADPALARLQAARVRSRADSMRGSHRGARSIDRRRRS